MATSQAPRTTNKAVAADFVTVVTAVMKRSSAPMVEFVERYDLSFSQLKVMFVLATSEEPLAIGSIAGVTGGSLPATGRAVDGLVRLELATRTEDPSDRRVKRVEITPLGTSGMDQIFENRVATLAGILAGLTDEELGALADALVPLKQMVERENNETEEGR